MWLRTTETKTQRRRTDVGFTGELKFNVKHVKIYRVIYMSSFKSLFDD